jgi:hypothetical protein
MILVGIVWRANVNVRIVIIPVVIQIGVAIDCCTCIIILGNGFGTISGLSGSNRGILISGTWLLSLDCK